MTDLKESARAALAVRQAIEDVLAKINAATDQYNMRVLMLLNCDPGTGHWTLTQFGAAQLLDLKGAMS